MPDPITLWREDGAAHGWFMPHVPGWWRWWGVRHVRWWCVHDELMWRRERYWRWVLFGIWHGLEGDGQWVK